MKNWLNYKDTISFESSVQSVEDNGIALSQDEIRQIAEQASQNSIKELLEELPD